MKIKIIPEKCIACGLCHSYAPNVFDYYDDGIVKFYDTTLDNLDVSNNNENQVNQSIKDCPTHAIIRL